MHVNNIDVAFLQETHSSPVTEKWWSTTWGKKIWFSHGDTNARGVAILFSSKAQIEVHNIISSSDGRYIILYTTWNKTKVLFANIYAPNRDNPQFFMKAFKEIERFNPDYKIIAGDCNLALDSRLDRMGSHKNNERSATWLHTHIENQNTIDVWQTMKEEENGYTYCRLQPRPMFSRLDYFFISENFLQFVRDIELYPAFKTDHSIIVMTLGFELT